ncbi:MAG: iron-containing redox enzyme family protein [Rhodospirillum sp.]|nr:iron-containing redox enzyme family protein [Rhodospirillum sp.]MCF8488350.1 iron-containing redox enzyme family protein [Rhodospirillum sp.]
MTVSGVTDSTSIRVEIERIASKYKASEHCFFSRLGQADSDHIRKPDVLGELLLRYQAAMHSTRAMAYCLPMLDSPALRKRKLRILVDDDGLEGGDTHHYQLTRAFEKLGAELKIDDEAYGDLDTLQSKVDGKTAKFISAVRDMYLRSLGAWAIAEVMSDDWLHALADGLEKHFPKIVDEPYFAECFNGHVEERHGLEALELAEMVCAGRPELAERTISDAKEMAQKLNHLWDSLLEVVEPN